jgi:virginiamycin B lyase
MSVRRPALSLALSLLVLIAGMHAATAAAATPGEISEFPLVPPCLEGSIGAASREGVLVRRCEGSGTTEKATVGNLLAGGKLSGVATVESPGGPLLGGPNGEVWIATNAGGYSKEPVGIARVASDGSVQRFPFPNQSTGPETKPEVRGFVIGKEGALWAAVGFDGTTNPEWYSSIGGELVRITPDGTMTEFPTPVGIEPRAIALGPDGNLWFTALSGQYATEHTYTAGTRYIGRMTPTGQVDTFVVPHADPVAIGAAPDGTLWFGADGTGRIGTIGVDGQFGRDYQSLGAVPDSFVFGPEGDLWGAGSTLFRLTPWGQRTSFGLGGGNVALGVEGDIWAYGFNRVWRVVPGAPGLDLWGLTADPKSHVAKVKLACGGSTSGCEGTLKITLPRVTKLPGRPRRDWKHSTFLAARRPYAVAAESSRTVRVRLVPVTFKVVARYAREHDGAALRVSVEADVAGGPSMVRKAALRSGPAPRR